MKPRLAFTLALAASWMLGIGLRLYDLQIRKHEQYSAQATRQQQRVVTLDPPRGTIYDQRGRELAVSVEVQSAYADPNRVQDPEATASAIADVLPLDRVALAKALASDRAFVWVSRKLDPHEARALEALALPGIAFVPESKRYYPLRTLAAQILGYVGTDNRGLAGLETLYDEVVASEPGRRRVLRDARTGTVLNPNLEHVAARSGRELHLTLDAAIQNLVERELAAAVEESGAKSGTVVMMEPHSGAILAMATVPTYDPNRFARFPKELWRIPSVMDAYEPGSTFKMVTLAGALDRDVVDTLDELDCQMGSIRVAKTLIRDHTPFPVMPVWKVIAKSSNVGAIKLGLRTGKHDLYDTIRAFGFGQPTGIDLPGESPGIVWPVEKWSALRTANVAFGQAISVTPLQLTRAFAAVANGGWLPTPYVVERIGDEPRSRAGGQALAVAPSTLAQVRQVLETVVVDGTAKRAAMEGFRAAGKTGTAQKAEPGKGYLPNRYIASFVGFAPVEDPAVVVLVMLDEPWPLYHGGEVAAPVFGRVVHQTLLYLGVEPRRGPLERWPGEADRATEGPPGIRLASMSEEPPPDPPPPGTVPDLTGLSARQAVARSSRLGLRVSLDGHGFVTRQEPFPGQPLGEAGGQVALWLEVGGR